MSGYCRSAKLSVGELVFALVRVASVVPPPLSVMVQLYVSPVFPMDASVMVGVHGAQAALLVIVKSASGVGYTVTVLLWLSLHPF